MNVNKEMVLVCLVVLLGVFLRFASVPDLMHFELDQARDAFVVYDALKAGNWPQKGPIARGSELFLGPIFYYFQIIAAKIFAVFGVSTLVALALPDILSGLLALPLAYLLLRKYFSRISVYMTLTLASTSLFLISYSTFAWNPNSMFLWSLVLFYSMLSLGEVRSTKRKCFYTALIAIALAVLIQLHFIAFLCLPLILTIFFISQKTYCNYKVLACGIAVFLVLISPMIVYEIKTSGSTTKALSQTILEKNAKESDHTLAEKLFRNYQKTATYFTVTMVADQEGGSVIKTRLDEQQKFLCNDKCKKRLPHLAYQQILFAIALVVFILKRKMIPSNLWKLTMIWLVIGGIFLTLVAYQISPRFYLFMMPVFLVLWTQVFQTLEQKINKKWGRSKTLIILALALLVLTSYNIYNYTLDRSSAKQSQIVPVEMPRDLMLGRTDRVTLGALRQAADTLQSKTNFVIVGDNRYARALHYLLTAEKGITQSQCYIKRSSLEPGTYKNTPIQLLVRQKTKKHLPEGIELTHIIQEKKEFGTITLYSLVPKSEIVVPDKNNPQTLPENCVTR